MSTSASYLFWDFLTIQHVFQFMDKAHFWVDQQQEKAQE